MKKVVSGAAVSGAAISDSSTIIDVTVTPVTLEGSSIITHKGLEATKQHSVITTTNTKWQTDIVSYMDSE